MGLASWAGTATWLSLARAARLQPERPRWRKALSTYLTSWIAALTPEIGIHWYSNLEIALRSLNWLQILALAGDQLEPSVVAEMSGTLYRSGSHLVAELPYTLSMHAQQSPSGRCARLGCPRQKLPE